MAVRSSLLVLFGMVAGIVLFLAHRSSQQTGKNLVESLSDVPTEAAGFFTGMRDKAEDAVDRGREAYVRKQAEIDEQLEDITQS